MKKSNQFIIFLLITLIYVWVTLSLPVDPAALQRYHLNQVQAIWTNLSVIIPLAAVWLSAFYGYITFRSYAENIKDSVDGEVLHKLSTGLMILAFSLPLLALIGAVFSHLAAGHPKYLGVMVVVRHIFVVGFPLAAFMIISNATELLVKQIKRRTSFLQNHNLLSLLVIIASSLFCGVIVALMDENAAPKNLYSFPAWAVILLLVVPYMYLWYRGITAVYNLYFYRKHVKGHLYKKSFGYLAFGLGTVIVLAILIQLATVLTPQLQRLHFTPLLFMVYALIALYALGYGMIAAGAKRLTKIEEV